MVSVRSKLPQFARFEGESGRSAAQLVTTLKKAETKEGYGEVALRLPQERITDCILEHVVDVPGVEVVKIMVPQNTETQVSQESIHERVVWQYQSRLESSRWTRAVPKGASRSLTSNKASLCQCLRAWSRLSTFPCLRCCGRPRRADPDDFTRAHLVV